MQLTDMGFRRSGEHIYRPWCEGCGECKSVRVPVAGFNVSKSQKRVLTRNKDLQVSFELPSCADEIYNLYANYIIQRHSDGDMYPPSLEQFENFLCQAPPTSQTRFVCFRLEQKLLAVAVVDLLPKGVSAIYTFFDPAYEIRSLGRLAVLWQIRWAQSQAMDFVYLGYWIKDCQKMAYKAEYQPLQVFEDLIWQTLTVS
ncbi:MAG: arginyl-tRNA--protein-N-Asp/Glu arginylyltransferase [Candidatus Paceibacteria bacterium]|jgi:arginyl-tRNA--protein-N-Asp/Glu arginylyltransferase|tara:strand:- start:5373 stop:5969 length:597 start_codon:yes stop_codon:yes gene_type:complete